MANKPTLLRPDGAIAGTPMPGPLIGLGGKPAGMSPAQLECIEVLRTALADAENGEIHACAIIACGPADFGLAIAGADAPRINLGLDAAKAEIQRRVMGK
jgi:hypothetical protein